jgi:hypothetical protein
MLPLDLAKFSTQHRLHDLRPARLWPYRQSRNHLAVSQDHDAACDFFELIKRMRDVEDPDPRLSETLEMLEEPTPLGRRERHRRLV